VRFFGVFSYAPRLVTAPDDARFAVART
jgi:hypothetical protein